MPTPFATIETRLGQVAAARLADATLTAGAVSVDGILDESRNVELGMQATRKQFIAPSGTGADVLAEDAAVTVTKNAVAGSYKLALPPQISGGQTLLHLKDA